MPMDQSSLAQIRERLRVCEAEVVSLKRMLNAHAPVNKLPRELLALIFSLQLPWTWNSTTATFHHFLGLSHVCSTWRSVAIETPSLWAVLPCGNAAMTSMALQRSGQAQLDITLWPSHLHNERQIQPSREILDASRLRFLDIHGSFSRIVQLKNELSRAAPLLRTLSIWIYGDFGDTDQTINLFNGETPRLSHLSLTGGLRFFRRLDLGQLRSLSLQGDLEKVSPLHLVDALGSMPKLQLMGLDDIFDFTSGNPVTPVHVQHLQHLTIHDHYEPSMMFIRCIGASALVSVQLRLDVTERDLDVDAIAGVQIIRSFRQLHGSALQYINATEGYNAIGFVAAKDESEDRLKESVVPNGACRFEVIIERDEREEHNPQDAIGLLKLAATLFEIRSLDLLTESACRLTAEMWLDIFKPVSHTLRDVRVSGASAHGLITALGLHIDEDTANSESYHLFLAGLEHLRFYDVDFRYSSDLQVTHEFGSRLRETMQTRASEGLDDLTIYLYGCRQFLADIQTIKEAKWVKDVVWDEDNDEDDSEVLYEGSSFSEGSAEDDEY